MGLINVEGEQGLEEYGDRASSSMLSLSEIPMSLALLISALKTLNLIKTRRWSVLGEPIIRLRSTHLSNSEMIRSGLTESSLHMEAT